MSDLQRVVVSIDTRANGVTVTAGIMDASDSDLVEMIENVSSAALSALRMNAGVDIAQRPAIEEQTSGPGFAEVIEELRMLRAEVVAHRLDFRKVNAGAGPFMAVRPVAPAVAEKADEFLTMNQGLARIVIDLLPDGLSRIRATCGGAFDASYAPLRESRLAAEVPKLVGELRERIGKSQGVA